MNVGASAGETRALNSLIRGIPPIEFEKLDYPLTGDVTTGTGQQTATDLVLEVDLPGEDSPSKKTADLFHLHRSAMKRDTLNELWEQRAATAPVTLASVLCSEAVLDAIRNEIRRHRGYNPATATISQVLRREVICPDLL